ncbi:hypothetical protein LR48_Vigan03g110900 [Vigna angularis]|uniref:Retrotransposon gag domain-containing protein n=1 Tax=Phaseolus angularis TaxID=3914 RepID=A0A0L9U4X5_PHAAN|nr:hypothetical protein LR48_Vigan03g110900 [Vigna angularis]
MGTQFFQGNLNHWWEPHSRTDQSKFWQAVEQLENQPQQQWQQQSSVSKLDDVFQQFMQESISTQKSIEASCKRMEMQLGHIIQKLDDFRIETEVNPREECQAIITGSDKIFNEKKIERKEKEELSEKDKDVEKDNQSLEEETNLCLMARSISSESNSSSFGNEPIEDKYYQLLDAF